MRAATSWKLMAIAGPSLGALVVLALSPPGRRYLLQHVTCELHVPRSTQALVLLAASVLSAAITLTFMTAALQNPKHDWIDRSTWVLAILFLSPLGIPLYWLLHLRGGDAESGS